ncbi:MAG: hypothetical protein ABSF64_18825 [Bryobacteraceae bacterium]|jgi:hypothetical protein
MTGSLADYYHWEETDKGIRIYMHAGMVDRLQAEVLRSGKEVGGILLGRAEEDRGKPVAFIDDFLPVPCSYRGGLYYDLSDEDTLKLEAALLRTALAGCESPGAPSALGYYRSHMREGMSLSPADLRTIESYFETPASVLLLVKTVAGNKACTAGFFFWEDGRIQPEFSSLEVALARTADRSVAGDVPNIPDEPDGLGEGRHGDLNGELPADLAESFRKEALPEPFSAPASESVPPASSGKPPRVWLGLLLRAATMLMATAALVISVVTYLGAPRPPREEAAGTPAASRLGLQVERNPPDLLVTWNRHARDILAARRATLSIRDGRIQKDLDLDTADLARGSRLFTPGSDDIQVRLEVFGADGGSVAQSIRASLGNPR